MLEVTVKTLDSQNHSFTVPDETTVKEFKDHIAPVLNIAADKQRLIFCGKVLKDDKKLTEYDVNGKVIHVVQSLPPLRNSGSSSTSSSSTSNVPTNIMTGGPRNHRDAAGFLLGAFTIPQDLVDPAQVQNIVQDVVSGMGEIGRNATVMSRASDDGSVDVHINLGRVPVQVPLQSEAQLRMNRVQTMLIRANHLLESLENGTNPPDGNVANSSSQTEGRNTPAEAAPATGNSSAADDNPNSSETSSSSEESISGSEMRINTEVPPEINLGDALGPSGSDRFRFEGLAHAAQAAISAAFATAAAAARAATASVGTPSTATPDASAPSDSTEPMDASAPEPQVPDFISPVRILPADPTVIAMDSLPSDSEPQVPEQTPAEGRARDSPSSTHHPDCPLSTTRTATTNTADAVMRRAGVVQPSVQTLANLMDDVIRVNTRLQPCLEVCRDLIRRDPALTGRPLGEAHRLFSRVSQLMHFLSHAYHSLSDLHINFAQLPPRSPRVRIISSTHSSSSLFQGIPIQAQISISTSSGAASTPGQSTTTTASMANREGSPSATVSTAPNVTASADTSSTTFQTASSRPVPAPRLTQTTVTPLSSISTSGTGSSFSFASRSQNPVVFMEVSTPVTADAATSNSVPLNYSGSTRTPFQPPPALMDFFQTRNATSTAAATGSTANRETLTNEECLDTTKGDFYCKVCESHMSSMPMWLAHCSGNRHIRNAKKNPAEPATTQPPPIPPTTTTEAAADSTSSGSPRTPASTTGTQYTASTPPLSIPFRSLIPVPLTSMGSLHTFDSGLPCHSVWALEPSRRRHNAGGSRNSSNVQASVSPNIPGLQEDQLQQVISSIMMSLLNHAPNQGGAPVPAGFTVFTSRSDDSPRDSTFIDAMNQATRDRAARRAESNGSQPSISQIRASQYAACHTETLQLFDALGVSNMTISEILPNLSFNEEDILGKLLRFLADILTFKDIVDISFGKFDCFNRIERPLKTFFHTEIFKNENPQESDIESVVQKISNEFENGLQFLVNSVEVRPSMDYKTAISAFLRQNVRNVIIAAISHTDTHTTSVSAIVTYGNTISMLLKNISRELLSLNEQFTVNGNATLENLARETIEPVTRGITSPYHGAVKTWLQSAVAKFMKNFSPRTQSSPDTPPSRTLRQLRSLRRGVAEARSSSSDSPRPNRNIHSAQRANIVEALGVNEALAGGLSASRAAPTLAAFARIAEQTNALLRNNTRQNDSHPTNHVTEVVIGSESWHNAVPSDWVPIISRDINRTRRQAPQAPFSNAYLSGMPSKRRKIMTNGNPTLLEPSQSALSEMLLQAISSADVRPTTNIEDVKEEASQDGPLQSSFTDHMKHAIQERLQRDLDYCSERFPNSERYFK